MYRNASPVDTKQCVDTTAGVGAAVPDSQYIPPSLTVPGIVEAEYFKQGIYTHVFTVYILL
jgi:hypothetical protein